MIEMDLMIAILDYPSSIPHLIKQEKTMEKMWTVWRREYLSRVKTRGFIIGTIALPLVMLLIFTVPIFLSFFDAEQSKHIAVIDQSGAIFDSLQTALAATTKTGERLYNFIPYNAPGENLAAMKDSLLQQVNRGELDAYLIIPATVLAGDSADYYGLNVSNRSENRQIENALSNIVTDMRIQQQGLDAERIRRMNRPVDLNALPAVAEGEEKKNPGFTFVLAYFLGFFIYITMFIYGAMVMRSVIEEKTSRVIESVISSIKPFQLMAGKIFGVGAVGLTQFLIWGTAMGLLSLYGAMLASTVISDPETLREVSRFTVPLTAVGFFVLFFVLGYFLYSTIYAGIGAMVNSDQEAQQLLLPVSLLIVVPIVMIVYIIGNPSSPTSVLMSLVPFFAPIIMLTRIVVEMPPLWQILLSIALIILTTLGMIWLVGRIYRVGVLMYGKRPTLMEVVKWVKHA